MQRKLFAHLICANFPCWREEADVYAASEDAKQTPVEPLYAQMSTQRPKLIEASSNQYYVVSDNDYDFSKSGRGSSNLV